MNENLKKWLEYPELDSELKEELLTLTKEELEDAFLGDLSFGTGGLRGIIGAGTNRLNIYVIRKTTYGFLKYLQKQYPDYQKRGVVIGFDSRKNSRKFACEAAAVLGAAGVKVYLSPKITPTPTISFTVRDFNCAGGIILTASHNPPQYNGYKVFDHTGCQLLPEASDFISYESGLVIDIFSIPTAPLNDLLASGIVEYFDNDERYMQMVKTVSVKEVKANNLRIVYTALHGAGALNLPKVLAGKGFDVITVPEQLIPDPEFSTVKYPNPEDPKAFQLAEQLGKDSHADLLIATDPDADRMGAAVRVGDGYYYLSGNELGALMLYYLAKYRKVKGKGVVITTIVTSSIAKAICMKYNLEYKETFTGFKYIGTIMNEIEKNQNGREFLFGYEESFGFVIKDFIRDKDGFQASLLLAEMASFYKEHGKTLVDVLHLIDKEFGYIRNLHLNIDLEGTAGLQKVNKIMGYFRTKNPFSKQINWVEDYLVGIRTTSKGQTKLSTYQSNVIKFGFEDKWWIALRPSGTEPKLKLYLSMAGESEDDASFLLKSLTVMLKKTIDNLEDKQ